MLNKSIELYKIMELLEKEEEENKKNKERYFQLNGKDAETEKIFSCISGTIEKIMYDIKNIK